jgi:hypothetical protein
MQRTEPRFLAYPTLYLLSYRGPMLRLIAALLSCCVRGDMDDCVHTSAQYQSIYIHESYLYLQVPNISQYTFTSHTFTC